MWHIFWFLAWSVPHFINKSYLIGMPPTSPAHPYLCTIDVHIGLVLAALAFPGPSRAVGVVVLALKHVSSLSSSSSLSFWSLRGPCIIIYHVLIIYHFHDPICVPGFHSCYTPQDTQSTSILGSLCTPPSGPRWRSTWNSPMYTTSRKWKEGTTKLSQLTSLCPRKLGHTPIHLENKKGGNSVVTTYKF